MITRSTKTLDSRNNINLIDVFGDYCQTLIVATISNDIDIDNIGLIEYNTYPSM